VHEISSPYLFCYFIIRNVHWLVKYWFVYYTVGYVEEAICVCSAGSVTRFQPLRIEHFWWWDNKFPLGFRPSGNMRVSGVISALSNMTLLQCNKSAIALYSRPYLYNVVFTMSPVLANIFRGTNVDVQFAVILWGRYNFRNGTERRNALWLASWWNRSSVIGRHR